VLPFVTQPEHALPLVGMLAQAQLSIEDLLGQISKGFIEQLLVLSAEQVAGAKHPGRHVGDVRWHGTQAGQVNIGKAKLKVTRPPPSRATWLPSFAKPKPPGRVIALTWLFSGSSRRGQRTAPLPSPTKFGSG